MHGYNRSKARATELIDHGLIWHDTPRELAEATDVTISMVSDDDAIEAVSSGLDGILAGLSSERSGST